MRFGTILGSRRTLRRSPTPPTPPELTLYPFFVATSPSGQEFSSYDRSPYVFWWALNPQQPITWTWRFASFTPPNGVWPMARAIIDGVVATGWVNPGTNTYTFTFTANPGHHYIGFEFFSLDPSFAVANTQVISRDFIVNSTGAPLATQEPWTTVFRFEREQRGHLPAGEAKVIYPGQPVVPFIREIKPRVIEPYTTLLTANQRWVRHLTHHQETRLRREFVTIPTGDIAIEIGQKFGYAAHTVDRGLTTPLQTLRDGPRYHGTIGAIQKIVVRRNEGGFYMMDAQGRLCHMSVDGDVTTILGWRLKPGELKAHAGIKSTHYMYATGPYANTQAANAHRAYYDSKWEYLGNWDLLTGDSVVKKLREPHGFAVASRRADNSIDTHDGKEFWICDCRNNRILYVNARTMDPPHLYTQPQFAPSGYTAPEAPTGQADVVLFAAGTHVDEPWDCVVDPVAQKLYWTNFNGNSIGHANLDGTGAGILFQGTPNPTNADLSITSRLIGGGGTLSGTRAAYLKEGGPGVGSCTRPQQIALTSGRDLIWGERYTYAIRRMNPSALNVSTVVLMTGLSENNGQTFQYDVAIAVDSEGTCGPQDDILVTTYHVSGAQRRYSITGSDRGQWLFMGGNATMLNGPQNFCFGLEYIMVVGLGSGRIVANGNSAGFQFVEITKRLPTDPADPNKDEWDEGRAAYYLSNQAVSTPRAECMALKYGGEGQGELGHPTFEQMMAWTDAEIEAHGIAAGIPPNKAAAFRAYVRWNVIDRSFARPEVLALDYSSSTSIINARISTYAKFNYVILAIAKSTAGGDGYKRSVCDQIRSRNPKAKILNYVVQSEIHESTTTSDDQHDMRLKVDAENWWLRRADGTKTDMFQQSGKKDVNWSAFTTADSNGDRWPQWKCKRDDLVLPKGSFDGIFMDNMLQKVRAGTTGVGDINLDGTNETTSTNLAANANVWFRQANEAYIDAHIARNPQMMRCGNIETNINTVAFGSKLHLGYCEGLFGASWGSENGAFGGFEFCMTLLTNTATVYGKAILATVSPQTNTEYTTSGPNAESRRWMRYGLCSSLLLDNVVLHMREGGGYSNIPFWHDEFDAPLGKPLAARESVAGGGWKRRYENGIVLVNPNGAGSGNLAVQGSSVMFDLTGQGYKRLNGTQDPSVNSGEAVSSVTLTGRNGLILVRA